MVRCTEGKVGKRWGWGGNGGVINQGMLADLHAESLCGHVWADGQKRYRKEGVRGSAQGEQGEDWGDAWKEARCGGE